MICLFVVVFENSDGILDNNTIEFMEPFEQNLRGKSEPF